MVRTAMARLPWLVRTRFWVLRKFLPIALENKYLGIFKENFVIYHESICWVYSLESPHRGHSNKYTNIPLFLFIYLFLFGFYSTFKNISFISSRSFIKGGRKPENPGKKSHDHPLAELGFSHVTRSSSNHSDEKPLSSTRLRGPLFKKKKKDRRRP